MYLRYQQKTKGTLKLCAGETGLRVYNDLNRESRADKPCENFRNMIRLKKENGIRKKKGSQNNPDKKNPRKNDGIS